MIRVGRAVEVAGGGGDPTRLPLAEFSARLLAAGLLSATGVTSNSSTSVRLIVKFSVVKLPSALVARMMMLWEVAASKLSSVPSATLTTRSSC